MVVFGGVVVCLGAVGWRLARAGDVVGGGVWLIEDESDQHLNFNVKK